MNFLQLERAIHDAEISLKDALGSLNSIEGETGGLIPRMIERINDLVKEAGAVRRSIRYLNDGD